ncbi:MAG: hypothetical protein Q8O39_02155 [bacterium]|nr:hypothetical protein [bacterium]
MKKQNLNKGKIVIYKTSKNEVELKVRFKNESVWLKQNEIALLFGKERTVITKHINKIFSDKEVDKKSNVQKMHIPNSDKPVEFYSLDVILAVGYRRGLNFLLIPVFFYLFLSKFIFSKDLSIFS